MLSLLSVKLLCNFVIFVVDVDCKILLYLLLFDGMKINKVRLIDELLFVFNIIE